MNLNRRSHKEDVLFVLALLVPAIFAGARYIESDHQMTQIAQAQTRATSIAVEAPASVLVAKAGR
jgi:uncharacterized membrane protein affecting hemolysin expression